MAMREQTPIPPRRSVTVDAHRAGHYSGLHPEDVPYITAQKQRYANPLDLADDLDYPGERTRMPTSARRYYDTRGNQVIQRGNQRFVIHDEPPPRKRHPHWMLILGIGMIVALLLWAGLSALSSWWTNHTLDATYGFPRTYQTDQAVGINDSPTHPSHFIFENLAGKVLIIFFPGGDPSHAKIYIGPTLFTDNADQVPVTGEFKDVGNGRVDIIVHIGDQKIIYMNDGTQFKPQQ